MKEKAPPLGDLMVSIDPAARLDGQLAHREVYRHFATPGMPRDFIFACEPDLGAVARVRSRYFDPDLAALIQPVTSLVQGERARFRLVASPARKLEGDRRRRAFAREDSDGRVDWLRRKASLAGFALYGETSVQSSQCHVSASESYWVDRAEFTGELEVQDARLFETAMEVGVGPHKAYGFGLLWIY